MSKFAITSWRNHCFMTFTKSFLQLNYLILEVKKALHEDLRLQFDKLDCNSPPGCFFEVSKNLHMFIKQLFYFN